MPSYPPFEHSEWSKWYLGYLKSEPSFAALVKFVTICYSSHNAWVTHACTDTEDPMCMNLSCVYWGRSEDSVCRNYKMLVYVPVYRNCLVSALRSWGSCAHELLVDTLRILCAGTCCVLRILCAETCHVCTVYWGSCMQELVMCVLRSEDPVCRHYFGLWSCVQELLCECIGDPVYMNCCRIGCIEDPLPRNLSCVYWGTCMQKLFWFMILCSGTA